MSGGTWQQQEQRRQAVSREARTLPREPSSWGPRLALGLATVAWLATLVWLVATLPERVPTHWGTGPAPDGWSSRASALAMSALLPPAVAYPMIWLSRLALVWPDGINVPHKEWWLERPRRLVRFERLVREDMMLVSAATVGLLAAADVQIGVAAHRPGGEVPEWTFPVTLVGFLAVIGVVVARMGLGRRYRPRDDDPDLE
ncbi:hypothetical protein ADJ73_11980 [Arsenicicoccus sp. oral taxon 190]|nr:hypothetical protein ADJ73_11980 [Arsenicicoccus sp. oral taxon 190]